MNMNVTINTRAAGLVAARNFMNEQMQPLLDELKDETIALEDRWNAYLMLVTGGVLTKIKSYGDGFVEDLNPNWTLYDTFYIERYETTNFPDMLERIMEIDEDEIPSEEVLNAWKEKVLASGYAGFEFDW